MTQEFYNKIYGLKEIKRKFQPKIDKPELFYTFIAPKDNIEYDKFIEIVSGKPGWSLSSILRDEIKVDEILETYFGSSDEFELYIMSEDKNTAMIIQGTVRDYIKKEGIDFKI